MYRDLIGEPTKFEHSGRAWWYQEIRGANGKLLHMRLFDEDGEFVGEFDSLEAADAFLNTR